METKRRPVAVASGFEAKASKAGPEAIFYGVRQKVESVNLDKLPEHTVLIFCSDERFRQHVEYHFDDMANPRAYVGWTMFASLDPSGVPIEVFVVKADRNIERVYSGKISVAYIEVGEKGKLIRVKPTD
jgi:hypothetical protein